MNRAAELDVRLTRKGGTLHAAIASSRTSVPPALVRGKSPEEVASLLPRLFAVCALAQGSAAAAACEAAMASETDPARSARRDFLAAAEAIREHLFRLVLGAAETLGEAPDPRDLDHLRLVTTALRQASGDIGPSDWRRISGGISSALASQIDAHFHRPEASGAYDAFLAWLDQAASPFARLCGRLHERGDDRLGAENDCQPGGDLDPAVCERSGRIDPATHERSERFEIGRDRCRRRQHRLADQLRPPVHHDVEPLATLRRGDRQHHCRALWRTGALAHDETQRGRHLGERHPHSCPRQAPRPPEGSSNVLLVHPTIKRSNLHESAVGRHSRRGPRFLVELVAAH